MGDAPGVVLLVEDSEHDVFFFRQCMKKAGVNFPLEVAVDGAAATDYLSGAAPYADRARHPLPRLILLDLKLPKKSGFEVLEWLRADAQVRDVRVIILTSSAEKPDIRLAYDLGAVLYIAKPIGMDALRDLVKAIAAYWEDLERGPQADLVAFAVPRPGSIR
jgi:CheY-like chemotaxis protein